MKQNIEEKYFFKLLLFQNCLIEILDLMKIFSHFESLINQLCNFDGNQSEETLLNIWEHILE